jgi:lipopolysaccharide biosynthesis glycosyltransferase
VFHDGLSLRKIEAVRGLSASRPHTDVRFVAIDPRRFFRGHPAFGLMSYARLLVPTFFTAGRVVYIDTDVWIHRDILHLMDRPMKTAIAAVRDRIVGRSNCGPFLTTLGVPADTAYFNAGVLVMDCELWSVRRIADTLLELGARHRWELPSGDQTLLNFYFRGTFDELPPCYNTFAWSTAVAARSGTNTEDVFMTHFLGRPKPWEIGGEVNCCHAMFRELAAGIALRRAPVEPRDVVHVASRVARYLPSYFKCVRRRVASVLSQSRHGIARRERSQPVRNIE